MLVMYTADQLRAFNRDVDVPLPRPVRKAILAALWQPLYQRQHKQYQLRRQPVVAPLRRTDDLTVGCVND